MRHCLACLHLYKAVCHYYSKTCEPCQIEMREKFHSFSTLLKTADLPLKAHDNSKARHASKQKCVANMPKLHKVRPVGLEPTTHGLRVRCYYQLS